MTHATAATGADNAPAAPIDLMSGEFYAAEPFEAYAWMRRHAPFYFDEANELWGVARYDDVKAVATDPETFSNAGGVRPKFPPLPMMIDFDAPEHVRRRRLVSSGFTPRRVREMEDHVRAVCDYVIDRVCRQGECDFVRDIAAPLPLIVIGDMLGVAEADRDDLLRWSEDMLRSQGNLTDEAIVAAAQAFSEYTDYIHPVIEDRRQTGHDDDLVGVLVHAEIDGDQLDDGSLVHESLLILIGGDETTRHVITGGMYELQHHPEQLARLAADPALLPGAVEEMLRWVTPIKNMTRTATRDVAMGDVTIHQGDELLLLYPSANRDESVFDRPEEFDIGRTPNPHVAFGFGAHFCLGNQLARLELRTMFEQLLRRLPDLALADGGPPPRRPSNFITGIEALPVTFTPTAPVGVAPA
jgi:cytochrome P450 family 142 subfamily A polypeptide 1